MLPLPELIVELSKRQLLCARNVKEYVQRWGRTQKCVKSCQKELSGLKKRMGEEIKRIEKELESHLGKCRHELTKHNGSGHLAACLICGKEIE